MNKISYVIKRISKMDYQKMFKTIKDISKETKKSKLFILNDMIYCGFKYQAGYSDYKLYKMYNMNANERKTIVTRGINNNIVKKYNNKSYIDCFENKALFNKLFNKYLNREWLFLEEASLDDFKEYARKRNNC